MGRHIGGTGQLRIFLVIVRQIVMTKYMYDFLDFIPNFLCLVTLNVITTNNFRGHLAVNNLKNEGGNEQRKTNRLTFSIKIEMKKKNEKELLFLQSHTGTFGGVGGAITVI